VKTAVLGHVQSIFDEMEEAMAMSHQEKYAFLEDACENATDKDELRVALEQWYAEYGEELELDNDVDEIWDGALGRLDDNEIEDEEEEEVEIPIIEEEEDTAPVNYNDEYEK
jgi:hypothetical protein